MAPEAPSKALRVSSKAPGVPLKALGVSLKSLGVSLKALGVSLKALGVSPKARRAHDALEARRLIASSLACFGLEKESLAALAKGDARKLAIARLVRERTGVPRQWIARELRLGHVSCLSSPELASPEVTKLTNRLLEISGLSVCPLSQSQKREVPV